MNGTERRPINLDWRFHKDEVPGADRPEHDDAGWERVNLPHDWTIEGPVAEEHSRHNGYFPPGRGWYRKSLPLDPALEGARVRLEFEGVFRNCTVWVNGVEAGRHVYGYTGFVLDITRAVRFGGEPNTIAVHVNGDDCGKDWKSGQGVREGWWYEGCGIYRNVWLIVSGSVHVADWGTFVTTPEVSPERATVEVRTTVRNDGPAPAEFRLRTRLLAPGGGEAAALESEPACAAPGEEQTVVHRGEVGKPALWSPARPALYAARTEVVTGRDVADVQETVFGIRRFEFTADKGFFLNGRRLELRGMCVHHDYGGLGVALPDRAHRKNVEVIKATGCNLLRSSHNDAAPALMDACDRLGLLVWAETRYLNKPEIAVPPLRELIRRNRNHPSIVCWGLANTAGSDDGVQTGHLKALNDVAHQEDPSRPTAFACEGNTDANTNGFAMVTDLMGYNGGGMGKDYRDHINFPQRKMLISEFSSGRGARGVYAERGGKGSAFVKYGDGRVMRDAGQYCNEYDLCIRHEQGWGHIGPRRWLAGGIMWSGIEYFGETTGWPTVTSQFGVLDVCRFPKDAWYYYVQEWTRKPMVHIFPHWNWAGREGQLVKVWCYTTCDEVELLLNGRSLGRKPRMRLSHIEWLVPYEPGVLQARGLRKGRVVQTREVRTAGPAARLRVEADRAPIADGQDVSFLSVTIEDANGVLVPEAENEIVARVTGAGRLLGLCSGDPGSHASPKTDRMRAFNGRLLAIVQSLPEPGVVAAEFAADGLDAASVRLVGAGTPRPSPPRSRSPTG